MKATITSLVVLALELIICLVSSRWGVIDVKDGEICFKHLLGRHNGSSLPYQHLRVGPLFSSKMGKEGNNVPQHYPSDHNTTITALFITGIALILGSAVVLSLLEFCSNKFVFDRYRTWFHLINVFLLTISLILLIVGFYLLQHFLKHPLNGVAALGFFIGVLFIVMIATHSATMFWTQVRTPRETKIEKIAM